MRDAAEEQPVTWAYREVDGAKILYLRDARMLEPFRFELKKAAQEFCRRAESNLPTGYPDAYTPDDVIAALKAAPTDPHSGAWIVVDAGFRLLGFLVVVLGESLARGRTDAMVSLYYLWPKRMNLRVSPALNEMLEAWARERGCRRIIFTTRRDRPKAWKRLGFAPIGVVYSKSLED